MKNWKTTITALGAAATSALTVIAALPYSLGEIATIIPSEYKAKIVVAGLIATTILKVINGVVQADANKSK